MLYNARSDGDGASINPAYLSLTTNTNARSGTYGLDTTYPTSHVRAGRSITATSSRPVDCYPTLPTGSNARYVHKTNSLPEVHSPAQPSALAEVETLHPPPPRSTTSAEYYPDSWDLLHQHLYDPSLLTYPFEDDGSMGQAARDTHAAPGPSRRSAHTHMDAGIASGGATLWGGPSLASGYSSLQDALLSPPVDPSKKRKVHDLDPESDVEGACAGGTSTSKRRKAHGISPAPMPTSTAGDGPELAVGPKKRSQRRSSPEARAVKAQGSKKIRHGQKDGIEALRQNRKLYPERPQKLPPVAKVIWAALAYIESSMSGAEVDQLKEQHKEEISAFQEKCSILEDENAALRSKNTLWQFKVDDMHQKMCAYERYVHRVNDPVPTIQ